MDRETGEIHVYMQKQVLKKVENDKTQITLEEAKKIDKKVKTGDLIDIELVPKNFECEDENVKITMDRETGEIHVYMQKEVVEEVENPKTQISLEEAKQIDKKLKVGDIQETELVPRNFGRIAAGTAKQVIIQKIREASREFLYNEFNDRIGEIVSGIVQKADGGVVVVVVSKPVEANEHGGAILFHGIEQLAVEAVGLASATAQQHAVHGMAHSFLGNGNEEAGGNAVPAFARWHGKPHRTQRVGNNRCALGIELLYLNLAAQFLALI
jgi:uncharacterized membrane protein YkoI